MKPALVLLHGLFGNLSNWKYVIEYFGNDFDIHTPELPILDEDKKNDLDYLVDSVHTYVKKHNLVNLIIVGNSLGGHVGILYTYKYANVKKLVLTGSSGLYENNMLGTFPRRHDYDYIRQRVEYTFYDPSTATPQLIQEVFSIVSDNKKCFQIIKTARTAQRNYTVEELRNIKIPTLLIWGKEDKITPINVAEEFKLLLSNSSLFYIDECGHAPMMEKPSVFNKILESFLEVDML
ncbi:alpha/beta fold hydrolase [Chryseobacterium ginsenosidimutans]|uniref:alpha/beta fold hydrolase n=1 Tax=Chryseobacterium ginsenosidimutans TaxID=687846 RepID=UPI0031DBA82A